MTCHGCHGCSTQSNKYHLLNQISFAKCYAGDPEPEKMHEAPTSDPDDAHDDIITNPDEFVVASPFARHRIVNLVCFWCQSLREEGCFALLASGTKGAM